MNLFPGKFKDGFAGHRFVVSLANQPPFVVKRYRNLTVKKLLLYFFCRGTDENDNTKWDGIEVRLISMLSELYNFTTDFKEVKNQKLLRLLLLATRESFDFRLFFFFVALGMQLLKKCVLKRLIWAYLVFTSLKKE